MIFNAEFGITNLQPCCYYLNSGRAVLYLYGSPCIMDRCPRNAVSAPYGVAEYLRLPLTREPAPIGD